MKLGPAIRIFGLALTLCVVVLGQKKEDPFIGRWRMDIPKSNFHKDDKYVSQVRTYSYEGQKIRVSWEIHTGDAVRKDSYSAACNGKKENAGAGAKIRCWKVDGYTVDGEMLSSDEVHRYYRRAVSPDGQTLTITWYKDPKRQTKTDVFIFQREAGAI